MSTTAKVLALLRSTIPPSISTMTPKEFLHLSNTKLHGEDNEGGNTPLTKSFGTREKVRGGIKCAVYFFKTEEYKLMQYRSKKLKSNSPEGENKSDIDSRGNNQGNPQRGGQRRGQRKGKDNNQHNQGKETESPNSKR